jgi:hypothetical protein
LQVSARVVRSLDGTLSFHGPVTGRSECVCQYNDSSHRHYDSLHSNIGHSDVFPFSVFTRHFRFVNTTYCSLLKGSLDLLAKMPTLENSIDMSTAEDASITSVSEGQLYYKRRKLSPGLSKRIKNLWGGGGFIIFTNSKPR